jgi:hypothetical protein
MNVDFRSELTRGGRKLPAKERRDSGEVLVVDDVSGGSELSNDAADMDRIPDQRGV